MLGPATWKLLYRKWSKGSKPPIPGYTLLLMVPGDLPVFMKIALEVCSRQDREHMVEAIVVPDNISPQLLVYFKKCTDKWKSAPLKLAQLNFPELMATSFFNNPHLNNWLQFIHGCNASNATHLLWHDADLFINDPQFFRRQYKKCAEEKLSCCGLSEVWDAWYKENGLPHLTSTWELMLELEWVKKFQPWQHRGHDGVILDKKHTFDITLLPQCLTSPGKIAYQKDFSDFVHFNYVIATYRHFQNSKGPYEDLKFKVLLVRLLIDVYDDTDWKYDVPKLEELVLGITDPKKRVTYTHATTRANYEEFRTRLQQLIDSPVLGAQRSRALQEKITPFDMHFSVYAKN